METRPTSKHSGEPEPFQQGPSHDRIVVEGVELKWNTGAGTFTFQGLPVAMMWVDSTLSGLMSGLATMVGAERFSLALQSEGRKSVESDWLLISNYPDFHAGFRGIAITAAVAGWGEWQLVHDAPDRMECRFRAHNTWEGLYQRKLGVCWGSAMLAGKLAGYCSKRFGVNCWATQTSFIAKGDPWDEFLVCPSPLSLEAEIERLLETDQATRADMAVALVRLREAQDGLLSEQENLEKQVRQRTSELAVSLDELQSVNERLKLKVAQHARAEDARRESEERLYKIIEHAPMAVAIVGMNGAIEYTNRKAVETFGYAPSDIPHMDQWWVLAYPDSGYRAEVITRWTRYITAAIADGREIRRDDYRVTCKDRSVKTISILGVVVADKVVVLFDDITLQALREDLLLRSNADLERRVQERTRELEERNRTLQAEIAERKNAEDRLIESNQSLAHTTAQLRRLGTRLGQAEENERRRIATILHDQIQQLLVSARYSISALQPDLSDERLRATAQAAGTAIEQAIRESKSLVSDLRPPVLREGGLTHAMTWLCQRMREMHGLAVEMRIEEHGVPIGEALLLSIFHAVRELLLNVVKHSGVTSACVELTVLPDAQVQVVVSDKGRGCITAAVDDGANAGYGLFAIRERFEALGGRVEVDSGPGKGFRVTLTAPVSPLNVAAHSQQVVSKVGSVGGAPDGDGGVVPTASDGKIRVLLVDDHMILRQGLVKLLSGDPCITVVGEASNGEVAIQMARSLRPAVVIMDVSMPKMSGIEATRVIHSEFPEMVIIGLSMYEDAHREAEMRRAGAAAYVSKIEAAEALAATVHACCRR